MRRVPLGNTHHFKFTTRNFSTGAPYTLAGTPVISIYEENNLTQITAGVTLTVDYDTVIGLNNVAVAATSGNGYSVGKTYAAVVTTGTVNSVSVVGEVVDQFEIVPAETTTGYPKVETAIWNGVSLSTTNPLPNAAAGAAGGLPTDSTGKTSFNDIAATAIVSGGAITTSGGIASADIKKINGTTVNGDGSTTPWGP